MMHSTLNPNLITWAYPGNSIVFIPLLVLMVVAVITVLRIQRRCTRMAHAKHVSLLFVNFSVQRQYLKAVLVIAALVCMGLAFMRPQWGAQEETVVRSGRDLVIALDISRSMLAQDYTPNRLAYAKEKIKKLVTELEAERVGLLIFSGAAVMQCPLTTDHQAFCMFLDALTVETMSSGTTSYTAALNKILDSYASLPSDRTRLVVLCTDGEDFSQDSSGAQAKLADVGVHICTFGIASPEGAPIPVYDDNGMQHGFQKDERGAVVISRRNDTVMKTIAQTTNGIYVPVTPDDHDILRIKNWVQGFEKSKWEECKQDRLQDRYYYFTAIACLLLLIEWIL